MRMKVNTKALTIFMAIALIFGVRDLRSSTITRFPVAPHTFTAQVVGHKVSLSWVASVSPNVNYRVYSSTVSGSGYQILKADIATLSYVDATVQAGKTYFYVLTAFYPASMSESFFSAEVRAAIPQVPTAPTITTTSVPNVTVGQAYSQQFAASGSTPIAWTSTATIPGLAMNAAGLLSGTPATIGSYSFTVTATNSIGSSTTPTLTLVVLAAPPPAPSFWTTTTVPAFVTGNDAGPVELGLKFSSSVAGAIAGIRFYKATNSTGTHTAHLWNAAGTSLGTGTFTNETASGWQTFTFPAPITITPGLIYTASYHTVQYAWSQPAFAAPLVVGSLTAPVNAGVYAYGTTSTFPKSLSTPQSNYWVDVIFQPAATGPPPVTITVVPSITNLAEGATQQFIATITGAASTAATWTATGGAITPTAGLFTAGNTPGTFAVTATSVADSTKSATVVVKVLAPPPSLTINCPATLSAITAMNIPSGTAISITASSGGAAASCSTTLP